MENNKLNFHILEKSFHLICSKITSNITPTISFILGSGWSKAIEKLNLKITARIPYSLLPALGESYVMGHKGEILIGEYNNSSFIVFNGRRHIYEGVSISNIVAPVYISYKFSVKTVIITNSAGSLNLRLKPGSVMIIKDHINMTGINPLIGIKDKDNKFFCDMTQVYNKELLSILQKACKNSGLSFTKGIYLAVSGPSYETPAEVRAFKRLGADAVGMSTVPEAILARFYNMNVGGLSFIANYSGRKTSHRNVLNKIQKKIDSLSYIIEYIIKNV